MPRTVHPDVITHLETGQIRPVTLWWSDWGSAGILALTNAPHAISYDGIDFVSAGEYIAHEAIRENPDLQAKSIKVALSGLTADIVPLLRDYNTTGRPVKQWRAFLDTNGQIIGDPILEFNGLSDGYEVDLDYEVKRDAVSLVVTDLLSGFNRVRGRKTSDKEQKRLHPGDRMFEYVASTARTNLVWK
jgi:hypothetical protein